MLLRNRTVSGHLREEPYAGKPAVRICDGEDELPSYHYHKRARFRGRQNWTCSLEAKDAIADQVWAKLNWMRCSAMKTPTSRVINMKNNFVVLCPIPV